ncbi:MAG: hypothetical protein NTW87_36810 [Planctomycetota bacterium]|nr:hypothetical protein [Planctomycetota bacterium]
MAQRALFLVVDSPAPHAGEWFAGLLPRARHGRLTSTTLSDATAHLRNRCFLDAVRSERILCVVGDEWSRHLPRVFRGVFVSPRRRGWKVFPAKCRDRIERLLQNTPATDRTPPATRRLDAAAQLMLNEPWDFFSLWLSLSDAGLAPAGEQVKELVNRLTPDIAVCAVLLSESSGCRWLLRTQSGGGEVLPPRPIEDVLPTLLGVVGVTVPSALPGKPLDLNAAGKPSGYTAEEEREIQKRLEDLGYL